MYPQGQQPQQQPQQPQQSQPQQPGPSPTQQRLNHAVNRLRQIRNESHNAVNPYSIRDRMVEIIDALEYMLTGYVSNESLVQSPSIPPQPDPNMARVQYLGGGMAPNAAPVAPPAPPINSSDVQLIPGARGSIDGGANGQSVEFYGGPAGSPHAGGGDSGQKVEFFGGPEQPQPSPFPQAAQGQPTPTPQQPQPSAPVHAQTPVSNPPTSQVVGTAPTISVEAGQQVPQPAAPQGHPAGPQAPAFADALAQQPQPSGAPGQAGGGDVHPDSDPMPIPFLNG